MVSRKRVNQPVISIEAMVQVGPWLIKRVDDGEWRNCDRCEADHKEVWICEIQAADAIVEKNLDGKREWRIGSTCGPKLMLLTNAFWGQPFPEGFWEQETKDLTRKVKLVVERAALSRERRGTAGSSFICTS